MEYGVAFVAGDPAAGKHLRQQENIAADVLSAEIAVKLPPVVVRTESDAHQLRAATNAKSAPSAIASIVLT